MLSIKVISFLVKTELKQNNNLANIRNFAMKFNGRRSDVLSCNGAVSSDSPLASKIGLDVLQNGGNCVDAAIAMSATLGVTIPCMTGVGGDAFMLYYDNSQNKVFSINGSGKSSSNFTMERVRQAGFTKDRPMLETHGLTVTVPGCVALWADAISMYGSHQFTLGELLQPAITLAETGCPMTEADSWLWLRGLPVLLTSRHGKDLNLIQDGTKLRVPKRGEVYRNQHIANVLKEIAVKGKDGFYSGPIADRIVAEVQHMGGVLTKEDLANHVSDIVQPISIKYGDVTLWETPPNGQGIIVLEALNILKGFDLKKLGHNSYEYLHLLIESIKLSFADAMACVADPLLHNIPVDVILSSAHTEVQRRKINKQKSSVFGESNLPKGGQDTSYYCAVDKSGNACSAISSVYHAFGSGIVPENCGFTLHNRGVMFSLDPNHPNCVAPNKRSYHTIIPALLTSSKSGEFLGCMGITGGYNQPQAHIQVLLNMVEFAMSPQEALDASRIYVDYHQSTINTKLDIQVEEGISMEVVSELRSKGHKVHSPCSGSTRTNYFGKGHVITRGAFWDMSNKIANNSYVLWAAADSRCDGVAMGY